VLHKTALAPYATTRSDNSASHCAILRISNVNRLQLISPRATQHNMKMKTLTLITAITATAITAAFSADQAVDDHSANIYVNNERAEKRVYVRPERDLSGLQNTRDIRIHRGERRQRESEVKSAEFDVLSKRVQIRLEAKFGGPTEALKHHDAIKYDCYFHASEFCKKYNESDSATRAYEMQEYVTTGLQEKAIKVANKSNALANTLANN
jgi:hypothetical protein